MRNRKGLFGALLATLSLLCLLAVGCKPDKENLREVEDYALPGGGVYTGSLLGEVPEGAGRLVLDGVVYQGTFAEGVLSGEGGKVTYPNGGVLSGAFAGKEAEGNYTTGNGDALSGSFTYDGKGCEGAGTARIALFGAIYEGAGRLSGGAITVSDSAKAKLTYPAGFYFEGPFVSGRPDAENGVLYYPAENGITQVTGFVYGEDGGLALGETVRIAFPDGSVFEGAGRLDEDNVTFMKDGELTYADGTIYRGSFNDQGQFEDEDGEMSWTSGWVYRGGFAGGGAAGQTGTLTLKTGGADVVWTGVMSGLPGIAENTYGIGSIVFSDGAKYEGRIKHTQNFVFLSETQENETGKLTFANGMNYVGEFKNGKYDGTGAFSWSTTGNIVDGWYFEGTFAAGAATYGKKTFNGRAEGVLWYEGAFAGLDAIDTTQAGTGYLLYADGCDYTGGMTANDALARGATFNGEGTFRWPAGDVYDTLVGTFENGAPVTGTKTFAGGDKYEGEFLNFLYHGQGKLTLANGDKYEGEFKDGKYDGQGKFTFANGMNYVGEFKNGAYDGTGAFSWSTTGNVADGWYFEGTFVAGAATHGKKTFNGRTEGVMWYEGAFAGLDAIDTTQAGTGYLLYADGCDYTGGMTANDALARGATFNGEGTFRWPAGDVYDTLVGTFENGAPVTGTKTMANGDKYEGEFLNFLYHGQGKLTLANGDKYEGEFKNGKYDGQGKFTYASGMNYVGEFKNGKYDGTGAFSWSTTGNIADGWYFEGTFVGGAATYGKKTFNDRTEGVLWYEGTFAGLDAIDTTQVGTGYLLYADGCDYTGGMTANDAQAIGATFNGEGTFRWPAGDVYDTLVGTFENGAPVTGTKTMANGDKYEGGFLNFAYHGQGKFTFANGMNYVGEFKNGKYDGTGAFSWSTTGNVADGWYFEGTFVAGAATYGKKTFNGRTEGVLWYEGAFLGLDAIDTSVTGKAGVKADASAETVEMTIRALDAHAEGYEPVADPA